MFRFIVIAEKRILQESDDEETPAGASSTVLEMPGKNLS